MHKYTRSQCDFRHEKSVMGVWFSNLVELIKIKVAVSCVNWELQVNLVVGLGKGGFCAGELLPLVESWHAGAGRRGLKLCRFLDDSAWGTVWNLETHTHKPDPASMENIPALWVLRQETWLAEKKSFGVKSGCPRRASSLLPSVASLVRWFQSPCTALIWGSWKGRDIWSQETGLALLPPPYFYFVGVVIWLSSGQNKICLGDDWLLLNYYYAVNWIDIITRLLTE